MKESGFSGRGIHHGTPKCSGHCPSTWKIWFQARENQPTPNLPVEPNPAEDIPKLVPLLSPVCLHFVTFPPGLFCRLHSEHIQYLSEHIHCLQTIFIQLNSTSRLKKVNGMLISECRETNIVGDKK